ncbi:hypothetical protein LJR084_006494 [Variovorax sp. LjRoot84]|uniref:hypothetical protein n=1 Tax=Variovorax sp. LjRoot84 TaxID=3342340 RepID=UPI003ECFA378
MLELRLTVTGGGYAAWEVVYVYPDSVALFAERLREFSGAVSEDAVLEVGSTEPHALNWLRLRAYVLDSVGHCAFQFASSRAGAPVITSKFDFSLPIEVAALNEMGKQLAIWALSCDAPLVFEAQCD